MWVHKKKKVNVAGILVFVFAVTESRAQKMSGDGAQNASSGEAKLRHSDAIPPAPLLRVPNF